MRYAKHLRPKIQYLAIKNKVGQHIYIILEKKYIGKQRAYCKDQKGFGLYRK